RASCGATLGSQSTDTTRRRARSERKSPPRPPRLRRRGRIPPGDADAAPVSRPPFGMATSCYHPALPPFPIRVRLEQPCVHVLSLSVPLSYSHLSLGVTRRNHSK